MSKPYIEQEYLDFLDLLKETKSIKSNRENWLAKDILYHIVGIYEEEWIALRYYKRDWNYKFQFAYGLWLAYKNGWIELRKK